MTSQPSREEMITEIVEYETRLNDFYEAISKEPEKTREGLERLTSEGRRTLSNMSDDKLKETYDSMGIEKMLNSIDD